MKEGVPFTLLNTFLTCIYLLRTSTKFQRFQDPDSKTQCLFIMGEYDDMKYLVKDGAKKLRDATNLTDEALLSINSFQKDLAHANPRVRALALRVMSSIRVNVIVPVVILAVKKCA